MTILHRTWVAACATMLLTATSASADEAREITWDDLVVDVALIPQAGGSGLLPDEQLLHDPSAEVGGYGGASAWDNTSVAVVEALDGAMVKLPGFVVPLELDEGGNVKEFLLVPYFGACIHYPPPPPNQIVYVVAEQALEIELTWDAIWVSGEMQTANQTTEYGSAAYTMNADTIEVYKYE